MPESPLSRRGRSLIWLQFFSVAFIWGTGFLFQKILVAEISVGQLVLSRVGIGAIVMVLFMAFSRRRWPRGVKIWLHMFALGSFFCVIPWALYAWGIQFLPSGLTSIFNSITPLAALSIAIVFIPEERLAGIKLFAFLAAAAGLTIIVSPWLIDFSTADPNYYLGQLACIAGSFCYAIAGFYTRWLLKNTPYGTVTLMSSMVVAATVIMLILTPLVALEPFEPSFEVIGSALLLGVFGTAVAFIMNANVIRGLGVTRATSALYISPIVAVAVGILVLNEQLQWYEVVGASIVILAVAVSQGALSRTSPTKT